MRSAATLRLAAMLLISPSVSLAQTPLTGAEFEALVTGRTMDYLSSGQVFGTEEYLPGRRVRWAFTNDDCKAGSWYEAEGQICFLYDGDPDPKCWTLWQEGGQLLARSAADGAKELPRSVQPATQPLMCQGPDVGV